MVKNKEDVKQGNGKVVIECPFCKIMSLFTPAPSQITSFVEHVNNAKIEILEGIKGLINWRIEALKKETAQKKKSFSKIKIKS